MKTVYAEPEDNWDRFNRLMNIGPIIWIAAILLIGGILLFTVRMEKVSGSEAGVIVNDLTGEITVILESGTYFYNGFLSTFHLIDMSVQRLEMTEDTKRGDRPTKDDLRIKTVDGSDVYLDVTINYLVRKDMIKELVQTSGLGDSYKIKWVRDFSRSVCRSVFGEMTTEEFYDANIRNEKALSAQLELNEYLRPYGIEINRVVAEKFRFHPEYEEKIKAKKLADQEVEEQISKANAGRQNQIFRVVEATKKKDVFIAAFDGQMRQLLVEANAEAEKAIRQSEGYAIQTRTGAEATFYEKQQNAQAITAKATAEAEGVQKMADALSGQGGFNRIKLEYARKLANMPVSGQPFVFDAQTERFSHTTEAATAKPNSTK
jgi:regulator of protease activity HflC (stomatin/prohibitin superfamily)